MKKAFVTLVNDSRYIEGAKVLRHSLMKTGTKIPLVVLVSDLTPQQAARLDGLGASVVPIEHVEVQTSFQTPFPARGKTFSKINAWLLEEYDRCVFIDADILVLQSIDYLFDYPQFSAVGTRDYFNTGVFVFEPNRETYSMLQAQARHVAEDSSYADDSEQEMLQRAFRDEFRPLPYRSNFRPYHHRGHLRNTLYRWSWFRNIFRRRKPEWRFDVIHYIGYPKPWETYLPECERDRIHYTWSDRQLKKVRWSFELWRDAWLDSQADESHALAYPADR